MMTQRVVHRLEIIEIDEEEGRMHQYIGVNIGECRQVLRKTLAVGKAGKMVRRGLTFQS